MAERLTPTQKWAVRVGSSTHFLGTRELGVQGTTMAALERRGLADVEVQRRPYVRCAYRLTEQGGEMRAGMILDEEAKPVEHERILVECTHCGARFPDGTPGGSCGECGGMVRAVNWRGSDA